MAIGSSITGAAAGIGQLKELRQRLFFVIGAADRDWLALLPEASSMAE